VCVGRVRARSDGSKRRRVVVPSGPRSKRRYKIIIFPEHRLCACRPHYLDHGRGSKCDYTHMIPADWFKVLNIHHLAHGALRNQ
jgi:hypothetical protein